MNLMFFVGGVVVTGLVVALVVLLRATELNWLSFTAGFVTAAVLAVVIVLYGEHHAFKMWMEEGSRESKP